MTAGRMCGAHGAAALGGAASSRAIGYAARQDAAPPRRGWEGSGRKDAVRENGEGRSPVRFFSPRAPLGRTRHHLPHWEQEGTSCFVTFRLADSLPEEKLAAWRAERNRWLAVHPGPLSEEDAEEYRDRFEGPVQRWLDAGHGECILRRPAVRGIVEDALRHFDGTRYVLLACVVMPNHVHALFTPGEGWSVGKILHSWKSYTATRINGALGRSGAVWEKESWDRFVRTRFHFERTVNYIRGNPGRMGIPVYVAGEVMEFLGGAGEAARRDGRLGEAARQDAGPPRSAPRSGDLGGAASSRAAEEGGAPSERPCGTGEHQL